MALATLSYAARWSLPTVIVMGVVTQLRCEVHRDGAAVAVTSGTVTLIAPGGSVVLSAVAVTIASGVAVYDVATATMSPYQPGDGWIVEWRLIVAGASVVFRDYASYVYAPVTPTVTVADIEQRHRDLPARLVASGTELQAKLDAAFSAIHADLINQKVRPWLNVDSRALYPWHLAEALKLCWLELATDGETSPEWAFFRHYEAEAERARGSCTLVQATEAGAAMETARRRAAQRPVVLMSRG